MVTCGQTEDRCMVQTMPTGVLYAVIVNFPGTQKKVSYIENSLKWIHHRDLKQHNMTVKLARTFSWIIRFSTEACEAEPSLKRHSSKNSTKSSYLSLVQGLPRCELCVSLWPSALFVLFPSKLSLGAKRVGQVQLYMTSDQDNDMSYSNTVWVSSYI